MGKLKIQDKNEKWDYPLQNPTLVQSLRVPTYKTPEIQGAKQVAKPPESPRVAP